MDIETNTDEQQREAKRIALGWPPGYFERTAGSLSDDPIKRAPQCVSIRCGHDGQGYIEVGEFDFQLCAECKIEIIQALIDTLEIKMTITPDNKFRVQLGECEECGAALFSVDSGRCGRCAFAG